MHCQSSRVYRHLCGGSISMYFCLGFATFRSIWQHFFLFSRVLSATPATVLSSKSLLSAHVGVMETCKLRAVTAFSAGLPGGGTYFDSQGSTYFMCYDYVVWLENTHASSWIHMLPYFSDSSLFRMGMHHASTSH